MEAQIENGYQVKKMIQVILGGVYVYKKSKAIISFLMIVIMAMYCVNPAYAASADPDNPKLKVSPYSDLTSSEALKPITEKSIINSMSFEELFSAQRLPYTPEDNGEKAELEVHYTISDKVTRVGANSLNSVDLKKQVQKLPAELQQYRPGKILYDEASKKAVLIRSIDEDQNCTIAAPPFDQIFEDLEIPYQSISLNTANIERSIVPIGYGEMTPFLRQSMSERPDAKPLLPNLAQVRSGSGPGVLEFDFPQLPVHAVTASGGVIDMTVDGCLKISDIGVEARYTGFDGYKFGITAGEEISLDIMAELKMDEEAYIPLCALDIPLGIGHVRAGLYLVMGINGEFTLEMTMGEKLVMAAGVKGATFCYLPSCPVPYLTPVFFDVNCVPDFSCDGRLDANMGVGPMLQVELLGYNILAAEIRIGAALGVKTSSAGSDYLDIDMDALLYSYFDVLGEHFTLLNEHWDLFSRTQRDTGGFIIQLEDPNAYNDQIKGSVVYSVDQGDKKKGDPYVGPITIVIQKSGEASGREESVSTDSKGFFEKTAAVDLRKNDTVKIKVVNTYGGIGTCEPKAAVMPFNAPVIEYADLFNDELKGHVSPVQIGTDEAGNPIKLEFNTDNSINRKITIKVKGPSSNQLDSFPLNCERGGFAKQKELKPNQFVGAVLESDGFTLESDYMGTAPGLRVSWKPIIIRDEYPDADLFLQEESADQYMFVNFTAQNIRGTKTLTSDAEAEFRIVQPTLLQFYEGSWSSLGNLATVQNSERENQFTFRPLSSTPGRSQWIDLYTYRWTKPEMSVSGIHADTTDLNISAAAGNVANNTQAIATTDIDINNNISTGDIKTRENIPPISDIYKKKSVDYGGILVNQINDSGVLPPFNEENENKWKQIAADYNDTESHGAGFDIFNTAEIRNHGYLWVIASYEYEGASFEIPAAYGYDFYHNGHKDHTGKESPRDEDFIANLLKEKEGLLVHPDFDVMSSLEQLKSRYGKSSYIKGTISNENSIPSWALPAVRNMIAMDIMSLEEGNKFPVNRAITKGELTACLSRLFGLKASANASHFSDVGSSYKYCQGISAAFEAGIIDAEEGGEYNPDLQLDREQACGIIYNALNTMLGTEALRGAEEGSKSFKDTSKLAAGSKGAIRSMAAIGLLDGFTGSSLKPSEAMTTEQTAAVLEAVVNTFLMH